MAAKIGDKAALNIYLFLLKHTAKITEKLAVDKEVYYSEEIENEDVWNKAIFKKKVQTGSNLGERMKNAFQEGFQEGYENIIIIGSDLYDLDDRDLDKAFEALENSDYIIGPAVDGGYYLLGMKSLNLDLFKNKSWSTDSVFRETIKDMNTKNITILEKRNDIDHYEDIEGHPAFLQFLD